MENESLLILGGGFTGSEVTRIALARGAKVVATTRSQSRADALRAEGIVPQVIPALSAENVTSLVAKNTKVLITFPPDGATDQAIAEVVGRARAVVYVSSTGVYGAASGRVDESTPTAPRAEHDAQRLDAEACWRGVGATVIRAPGIYGASRGLHTRLKQGTFRMGGDGRNVLSRVHVHDLARAILGLLERAQRRELFVIADDAPTPIGEVVAWLCTRMKLPLPPRVPLEEVGETMRGNRSIDNRAIKAALDLTLMYPTYREGFEDCLKHAFEPTPG